MKVDIDPDDAKELKADERGRVCLGPDHKDATVKVVVLESNDE